MKIINIGVLAHVDAGKTTLTESYYILVERLRSQEAWIQAQQERILHF